MAATHYVWDGEAHPKRGWRMVVSIHETGKRTRKLRSAWRSTPNEKAAYYLGHVELRSRLAEEIASAHGGNQ